MQINGMNFDETYGWTYPTTRRLIRKYNVSPSDFWTLHDYYESDYREIERCIVEYSKNENYYEYKWMEAEVYV